MKLAFSTLGCPDWTWEQILDNAQAMGFQGIELRGIGAELRSEKLEPLLPENVAATQAALAGRGLTLCCLGTSVSFDAGKDPGPAIEEGLAAIAVCARMGIPYLRIFGNSIAPGEAEAIAMQRVAKGMRTLCEAAEGTNVKILLEVHGNYDRVERILPIMEQVAHPQAGILWDIAHSDAVYGANFERFYRPLAPYIHHIHVKDHISTAQGHTSCLVGEGSLPVADIIALLLRDGYAGFLSLEWEKRWSRDLADPSEAFPAYLRWVRALEG